MQRSIVLTLLLVALVLLIIEQRDVGRFPADDGPLVLDESLTDAVHGGYSGRRLSRRVARIWGLDADLASDIILSQAAHYPLDADQWLNLARIEASRAGAESPQLSSHLNAAVAVNAGNRNTLWRSAQIALQAEDYALAEGFLYRWLLDQPQKADLVLMTAGRWLADPAALIERVLPTGSEFLARSMQYARRQSDIALGEALWQRVGQDISLDDPALLDYVDLLLRSGETEQAMEVWARHDPEYRPGGVVNGSFSRPLGESAGLNWQTNGGSTDVDIALDDSQFASAPASLRIRFKKENVRLDRPSIMIPVSSGGTYRLSGKWRGEGLTTRSLPFLTLQVQGTRQSKRVELPAPDFDWSDWSMTASVPAGAARLVFRVQRDTTEAFDRFIEGDLWLDSIELERIDDLDSSPLTAVDHDAG
jgi:hypothetical protein